MKFNAIGTAESSPQLHKSHDGVRGLCGAKVIDLTAEQQEQVNQAQTCGELFAEPCQECNLATGV